MVLVLPGILFVLVPLSVYHGARKRWNSAPELRVPRTYYFSDTGISIAAETFKAEFAWTHIVAAFKSRDHVLLGTAQRQFHFVRTSDFESPEQFARFLELVKRNVPKCRF